MKAYLVSGTLIALLIASYAGASQALTDPVPPVAMTLAALLELVAVQAALAMKG